MEFLASATSYGKESLSFFTDLSIASIVVLLTVAALFGFALRYGKDRIVALILSIYVGLLLFLHFPYSDKFLFFKDSDSAIILSNAIVYIAFVLIAYIVLERIIWTEYPRKGGRRFFEAFALALSAAALLLSFAYNILPIVSFYPLNFSSLDLLFASPDFFFWWLIAPLVVVLLLARR